MSGVGRVHAELHAQRPVLLQLAPELPLRQRLDGVPGEESGCLARRVRHRPNARLPAARRAPASAPCRAGSQQLHEDRPHGTEALFRGATGMPEPPTSTITSPAGHPGGRFGRSNGAPPAPPSPPKPKLKKLRLALVLAGLSVLALISTVFGMLMAVASDLPALENRAEYDAARNSVLYAGLRSCKESDTDSCDEVARLTGNQNRILLDAGADLAQHQERRHRDRGPALLRARGRGLPGHRPRALAGHPPAGSGPGRLDDHPAVRQERALGAGGPLRLPEAARGGARLPPRAQVVQGQDAHPVPEHRVLRQRRLRRGVGGAHLLRDADPPGGRHDGRGLPAPSDHVAPGRDARRGGAARRA